MSELGANAAMKIGELHFGAFSTLMEDRNFKRIAPDVWRSGMVTASIQKNEAARIVVRHKSGLTYLDETLYTPQMFNAVLAALEKIDFTPAKNTVFLAMAGAHNTTHYLTTANGNPHVVCDPHVLGPSPMFKKINRKYRINRNISVGGISLKDKEAVLTAHADGRVEIMFAHDNRTVIKRINPETASHILTCERIIQEGVLESSLTIVPRLEEVALVAPTSEYDWRVASKGMNIPIKGRAKFNVKKGAQFGLRKKGEKFYVIELKDKDMSEYQINEEKYSKILGLSGKRRGKAPDLTGKAKSSHKKKANTAPRNKDTTKKAIVSPRTKALRKPTAKPVAKPVSPDKVLEKYQAFFKERKWTGPKMLKMLREAGVSVSKAPTKKAELVEYLAKYHGIKALTLIEMYDAGASRESDMSMDDKQLVAATRVFDWNILFRVAKRVAPQLLPDTRDPKFHMRLTLAILGNKIMTGAKWLEALETEQEKLNNQIKRLHNSQKPLNIGPAPVLKGTSYSGPSQYGVNIHSEPDKLPDDYRSPEQIAENKKAKPLKQVLMGKIKAGTQKLYSITDNDDSTSRSLKKFLITLFGWAGNVIEPGGAYSAGHNDAFVKGYAKSEDLKIDPHPYILHNTDTPVVSNNSTQYFFEAFMEKFDKPSSPIKIQKIQHARKGELNDVVDIYFSMKDEPNVVLISRLHLTPDDKKYQSLMAGPHQNMKVGDKTKFSTLAAKTRKINMMVAAVKFNPLDGEHNEETFRLLASLV